MATPRATRWVVGGWGGGKASGLSRWCHGWGLQQSCAPGGELSGQRGQEERVLEEGRSRPDAQEPVVEGGQSEDVYKACPATVQMTHLSH